MVAGAAQAAARRRERSADTVVEWRSRILSGVANPLRSPWSNEPRAYALRAEVFTTDAEYRESVDRWRVTRRQHKSSLFGKYGG